MSFLSPLGGEPASVDYEPTKPSEVVDSSHTSVVIFKPPYAGSFTIAPNERIPRAKSNEQGEISCGSSLITPEGGQLSELLVAGCEFFYELDRDFGTSWGARGNLVVDEADASIGVSKLLLPRYYKIRAEIGVRVEAYYLKNDTWNMAGWDHHALFDKEYVSRDPFSGEFTHNYSWKDEKINKQFEMPDSLKAGQRVRIRIMGYTHLKLDSGGWAVTSQIGLQGSLALGSVIGKWES